MQQTDTALITGASSGLGAEFADQLAARGFDVVLVARDERRLAEACRRIGDRYGVHASMLVADLLTEEGIGAVEKRIRSRDAPVTMLVNDAGIGVTTDFADSPLADEVDQLQLLVTTPMRLCHAALDAMRAGSGQSEGGWIINVSSVSAFTPRGSYGAAKAWVTSFSRWANLRYRPEGVSVTAVCPGFVRTEFHQRMGADLSGIPAWMWLQPDRVVDEALAASFAGTGVVIPSLRYRALTWGSRLLPDALVARAAARGR